MTTTITDPLKARHRTMWGLGDYPQVADDIVGDLGEILVTVDDDLAELGRHFDLGGGVMEWEYLLLTARRAD